MAAGDEVGVLALPADARAGRQRFLHHRRRVHEQLHLGAEGACDEVRKPPEPALEHVVVVAPLRVGRDDAPRARGQQMQRIVQRAVVEAHHHDAARLGPERAWGCSPLGGAGQPRHVPGVAQAQELPEPLAVRRRIVGTGHARCLEPE